ncbi:hypothetical protein AVHY2522_16740 [Acidovorax sp. SUPP2522]|uniref:hypothetical protein n=1 Tax=unclassified Acidovorax TaxID=2684926 RepID=UPI00234BE256|nr:MULTISPECIES: hypothetical protein [unclassified Acidovorax]WCM96570.1 hypothetical protein M5C96_19380 [Acidovorax sp. GBBC 1281]GKT17873.1 hypothetical protein AVHY2522_16740 [Acidovorax sp. SUPP2522]
MLMPDGWVDDRDLTFRRLFYTELRSGGHLLDVISRDNRDVHLADRVVARQAGGVAQAGQGGVEGRRAR